MAGFSIRLMAGFSLDINSNIGNGYLKSLFALAFQGFLIIVCVAIYAALLQSITVADNVHTAAWATAAYTILLCFILFKTGSLAKSLFGS